MGAMHILRKEDMYLGPERYNGKAEWTQANMQCVVDAFRGVAVYVETISGLLQEYELESVTSMYGDTPAVVLKHTWKNADGSDGFACTMYPLRDIGMIVDPFGRDRGRAAMDAAWKLPHA